MTTKLDMHFPYLGYHKPEEESSCCHTGDYEKMVVVHGISFVNPNVLIVEGNNGGVHVWNRDCVIIPGIVLPEK